MTKQECTGPAAAPRGRTADIVRLPRDPEATALRRAVAVLDAAGRSLASVSQSMHDSVAGLDEPLARIEAEGARARRIVAEAEAVGRAIEGGDLVAMTALQLLLRDRRRHRRAESDQPVTIRHRARRIAARLIDVSRGGAALTLAEALPLAAGSAVVIEGAAPFRGGIDARVVGLDAARCRIAFDPEMVAHGLFDPTAGMPSGEA